jgi:hypothetical protein
MEGAQNFHSFVSMPSIAFTISQNNVMEKKMLLCAGRSIGHGFINLSPVIRYEFNLSPETGRFLQPFTLRTPYVV